MFIRQRTGGSTRSKVVDISVTIVVDSIAGLDRWDRGAAFIDPCGCTDSCSNTGPELILDLALCTLFEVYRLRVTGALAIKRDTLRQVQTVRRDVVNAGKARWAIVDTTIGTTEASVIPVRQTQSARVAKGPLAIFVGITGGTEGLCSVDT